MGRETVGFSADSLQAAKLLLHPGAYALFAHRGAHSHPLLDERATNPEPTDSHAVGSAGQRVAA